MSLSTELTILERVGATRLRGGFWRRRVTLVVSRNGRCAIRQDIRYDGPSLLHFRLGLGDVVNGGGIGLIQLGLIDVDKGGGHLGRTAQ